MEKEDYQFEVTNLKISVKLPREVSLEFVEARCKLLYPIHRDIICKRGANKNILSVRYRSFSYVLFKRRSKRNREGIIPPQHCNITKISCKSDIRDAIGYLFVIVNQPPVWLNYTIDNYSCTANTNQLIDIVKLYINEPKIPCHYDGEKFPGLKIYSPKEISNRNLTSLVFKSGSVILVGGNNLDEYKKFFNWVLKIIQKYPEL